MPDGTGYDEDFYLWTQEQGRRLRAAAGSGTNLGLDWEHLAEEVEDLGANRRRELRSRLNRILEHLIKLAVSPAAEPRRQWIETVLQQRREVAELLEDTPSLRRDIEPMLASAMTTVPAFVAASLELFGERDAAEQVRRGVPAIIGQRALDPAFIPEANADRPTSASG